MSYVDVDPSNRNVFHSHLNCLITRYKGFQKSLVCSTCNVSVRGRPGGERTTCCSKVAQWIRKTWGPNEKLFLLPVEAILLIGIDWIDYTTYPFSQRKKVFVWRDWHCSMPFSLQSSSQGVRSSSCRPNTIVSSHARMTTPTILFQGNHALFSSPKRKDAPIRVIFSSVAWIPVALKDSEVLKQYCRVWVFLVEFAPIEEASV